MNGWFVFEFKAEPGDVLFPDFWFLAGVTDVFFCFDGSPGTFKGW